MKPYARIARPTVVVRYTGSTELTISDETSVSRLTTPSNRTVRATRRRPVGGSAVSDTGRSRVEMYIAQISLRPLLSVAAAQLAASQNATGRIRNPTPSRNDPGAST